MGLFSRGRNGDDAQGDDLRLYYASDIHGTEVLWRKFLHAPRVYEAPVIVMGGDVTGKVVIPLVEEEGGVVTAELFGQPERAATPEEREDLEHRIRSNGMYPHLMTADEVQRVAGLTVDEREAWFAEVMLHTFDRWMALAEDRLEGDVRCFVMPGNDDPPGVDVAIERAEKVEACDGRLVAFGGYTMLSLGYSNRTPFDSPRELEEEEITERIDALAAEVPDMSRCIFNLHVPPYASDLDTAPALDEDLNVLTAAGQPKMAPCGSTAVREAIERHQPVLSLHGHVHESRGATRIGRTLSINPGSDYHTGRISGVLVHLRGDRADYQFVVG
jgi:Icc-related predicted phosphoesterase